MNDNLLFGHIRDFLLVHLPRRKNYSEHTVQSYRAAIDQLLDFIAACQRIPFDRIEFKHFTPDILNAWLDDIEAARGCSAATRNQRRASIGAFLKYCAAVDVTTVVYRQMMKKVPIKKTGQAELVEHMSEAAVSALLNTPDPKTRKGIRDRFFMALMYDLGARCQEMLDLRVKDLRISISPAATLHGKGGKIRSNPLRPKTVDLLRDYLAHYHPNESDYSEEYLFYLDTHGKRHPLSHDCVERFLRIYGDKARQQCAEVPARVHSHLLRHSRAMHLYQHGVDLSFISQWLGHANIETTLVYAHADTELKRAAIAAASMQGDPLASKLNSERYKVSDKDTLKKLMGLR
jgi:site-specific recombinase XerD